MMSRFVRYVRVAFSNRVVDLRSLPRSLRLLAILGYACVALMLGATLLLELAGSQQSGVEFRSDALSTTLQIPTLAMVFSALSLALGWAFVLTGASG